MTRLLLRPLLLLLLLLLLLTCTSTASAVAEEESSQEEEGSEGSGGIVSISYAELQAFAAMNTATNTASKHEEGEASCRVSSQEQEQEQQDLLLLWNKKIRDAFGPDSWGFLEITEIPPHFVDLRQQVLRQAQDLALHLPPHELDALVLPETNYTIGWSHGKEQFGIDPTTTQPIYDTHKGSFYFDPFRPHRNVFPTQSLPQLQGQLLELTHEMTQIALWVGQLCDFYLGTTTTTTSNSNNSNIITDSLASKENTKARLLYYFAAANTKTNKKDDDWCGWHKDHGSLTALLPGMLFDNNQKDDSSTTTTTPPPSSNENEDDDETTPPGLYIQSRTRTTTNNNSNNGNGPPTPQQIRVQLPRTSIGIQLGETVELQSGGRLVATPHAVKSSSSRSKNTNIARSSLAVFLQPLDSQGLPACPDTADDSLKQRHRSTFGEFQKATTQAFQ